MFNLPVWLHWQHFCSPALYVCASVFLLSLFFLFPLLNLSFPSILVCLSLTPPFLPPAGLWIRVGMAVLDPHRVPVTAGVALALVQGRGQVAAAAFEAWCPGAPRPGAGRWSRATCMPEVCVLASEWRMVTRGTHEGLQWAQQEHGVGLTEGSLKTYHEWNSCMTCPRHNEAILMLCWCIKKIKKKPGREAVTLQRVVNKEWLTSENVLAHKHITFFMYFVLDKENLQI